MIDGVAGAKVRGQRGEPTDGHGGINSTIRPHPI